MKKMTCVSLMVAGLCSTSVSADILQINQHIQDHGNFTRDLTSGLDWLDVTATRGMAVHEVNSAIITGNLAGWRYATANDFGQLMTSFGFTAASTSCTSGGCVSTPADSVGGESAIVNQFIKTLGDTYDDYLDEVNSLYDVSPLGAGETRGIIENSLIAVYDKELIIGWSGAPSSNASDGLLVDEFLAPDALTGSFLVRDVAAPEVPIPAAGYLFITSLLGLGLVGKSRRGSSKNPE